MTRTFIDDLFDGLSQTLENLGERLEQAAHRVEPERPNPSAQQPDESKLIAALRKCAPEYRTALTRLVAQTAVHVKQSNDSALIDAFVPAAIYTCRPDLARETLDAVAVPSMAQREVRGLLHYDAGNFPLSAAVFDQLGGHYAANHSRFAHVGALHRQGRVDTARYQRILNGLETQVAPAAEMVGIAHFNRADYGAAAQYFAVALEQAPTAQRMLNLMTAKNHHEALRDEVQRVDMPRLYQEFQHQESVDNVQQELARTSISFPYLKVGNMFELVGKIYAAK